MGRNKLKPKLITVLKEGYSLRKFFPDLIAGIIVGIVALPLAIAFAIARTATNIKNGGRTPFAGIVHAITLLLILIFFGPWASLIPMAALAVPGRY